MARDQHIRRTTRGWRWVTQTPRLRERPQGDHRQARVERSDLMTATDREFVLPKGPSVPGSVPGRNWRSLVTRALGVVQSVRLPPAVAAPRRVGRRCGCRGCVWLHAVVVGLAAGRWPSAAAVRGCGPWCRRWRRPGRVGRPVEVAALDPGDQAVRHRAEHRNRDDVRRPRLPRRRWQRPQAVQTPPRRQ
jgi:hypothetical protein